MRVFPSAHAIISAIEPQLVKMFCSVGFSRGAALHYTAVVLSSFSASIAAWVDSLPRHLQLRHLRPALRQVHNAGYLFLKLDRNPQRLVLTCRHRWLSLHSDTFLSPRYQMTSLVPCDDDPSWVPTTCASLQQAFQEKGLRCWPFRQPTRSSRPSGHFTVKQKSILYASSQTVKVRPLIAHHLHPLRCVLRRAARALSLLVQASLPFVQSRRPSHNPMWKLHLGTAGWLKTVSSSQLGPCFFAEWDVSDCFLNTPRAEVLPAIAFWLSLVQRRGRTFFSISKDSPRSDYIGNSSSPHFWSFPAEELLVVVQWELNHNDLFEVSSGSPGSTWVLQQVGGLPMGGHLSAAMVELVALHREYLRPWPNRLLGMPTSRYRDNFFALLPLPEEEAFLQSAAADLTDLLGMPVKLEGWGCCRRMLEIRAEVGQSGAVRCVLAFRDDADRQGESGDVTSWPPRCDPRTKPLLRSLLAGLAAKLRLYHSEGVPGLCASWRLAVQFVRRRGYPTKWWLRPLALAALRQGMPAGVLPRVLRRAAAGWAFVALGGMREQLQC
jgi:hypothetical protein